VIRAGDSSKTNPFTICIIANPALESPWKSGTFIVDPIMSDIAAFDACVQYINTVLFGNLAGQAEKFVADPTVGPKIRVVSLVVSGLPAQAANALAAEDNVSNLLVARQSAFAPLLTRFGLSADVAYAVSKSATQTRASAWFTHDDNSRGGVSFTLDGATLSHRYFNTMPGVVALHTTATSLTALHEFGHALSSWENGMIVDLYVDGDGSSGTNVNRKQGRPIPNNFATYQGTTIVSDKTRDSLGYPASWKSYHCQLNAPKFPAVMDDYWQASNPPINGKPEQCEHDVITRRFLLDRLKAKVAR
jgi:hypothetical protein